MYIAATGFGPFDRFDRNPSGDTINALKDMNFKPRGAARMRYDVIDCAYDAAAAYLETLLADDPPDMLVMFGVSGEARAVTLERTAWNAAHATTPDVKGRVYGRSDGAVPLAPRGGICDPHYPLEQAGPLSRASTLPLDDITAKLRDSGAACAPSDRPGSYLCNFIFYRALREIERRGATTRAGFIHVPDIYAENAPMTPDALAQAVQAVLQGCANGGGAS